MDERDMEEYAEQVHQITLKFVREHDLNKEDLAKITEYFRTCDDSVFDLPHDTIIRRAYTHIRRKD